MLADRWQISCIHHDNFATSVAYPGNSSLRGSVVDNDIFNLTISNAGASNGIPADFGLSGTSLPDLKSQIRQWLRFEKHDNVTSSSQHLEKRNAVFIIGFCLWDIWHYSYGDLGVTQAAVAKTIDSLFEQLDFIAEEWTHDVQILMLNALDLTYLPIWHMERTGLLGSDNRADHQRKAVALAKQWNEMLETRASHWIKGSVHIFDAHAWLSDQILVQQLHEQQVVDANGLGLSSPIWETVDRGCLSSSEIEHIATREEDVTTCLKARSHLFW